MGYSLVIAREASMTVLSRLGPPSIPDWAWIRPETRTILAARDVGALLRLAQQHGASQTRLSAATGIAQSRISELINGRRVVTELAVMERVAGGLSMPDDARMEMGLAPSRPAYGPIGRVTGEIARVHPSQAPVAAEIRRRAGEAEELDVLAVRGLGILGLNDSMLRPSLVGRAEPLRLRVLLLDPTCPAAERRAAEIGESPAAFASGIRLALDLLRELAVLPHLDVRVWLYCRLPVWRLIRVDDVMFVSAFSERWEGHESAVYQIPRTDRGAFWEGHVRGFLDVLESAEQVIP